MDKDDRTACYTLPLRFACTTLALLATATAVCLAAYTGWQRGAVLSERLLWIMLAVIAALACHLLPALARGAGWRLRLAAAVVWIVTSIVTIYGHASFVALAQSHVGQTQADQIVVPAPPTDDAGQRLVAIARERATIQAKLAYVLKAPERRALAARLDALNIEAAQAQRIQASDDRALAERQQAITQRDAARSNPVTDIVAVWLGWSTGQLNLIVALICAAALEGVAIVAWLMTFRATVAPRVAAVAPATLTATDTSSAVVALLDKGLRNSRDDSKASPVASEEPAVATVATAVAHDRAPVATEVVAPVTVVAPVVSEPPDPVTSAAEDRKRERGPRPRDELVERVSRGIARSELRGTVADIRRYLGCSQSNALIVRRQLSGSGVLA